MSREAIQRGWRDYDAAVAADKPINAIDLYDTPIDLHPVPKPDPIDAAIEHLYANGDMFGVNTRDTSQDEQGADGQQKGPRVQAYQGGTRQNQQG
jgi:hypothetical protein